MTDINTLCNDTSNCDEYQEMTCDGCDASCESCDNDDADCSICNSGCESAEGDDCGNSDCYDTCGSCETDCDSADTGCGSGEDPDYCGICDNSNQSCEIGCEVDCESCQDGDSGCPVVNSEPPCTTEGDPCTTEGNPCEVEGNPCEVEGNPCEVEGNPCTTEGNPCTTEGDDPCATEGDDPCEAEGCDEYLDCSGSCENCDGCQSDLCWENCFTAQYGNDGSCWACDSCDGCDSEGDSDITVYTVTLRYLYQDGRTISSKKETVEEGASYLVPSPPNFGSGHIFVSCSHEVNTYITIEGNVTITYIYRNYNITCKYNNLNDETIYPSNIISADSGAFTIPTPNEINLVYNNQAYTLCSTSNAKWNNIYFDISTGITYPNDNGNNIITPIRGTISISSDTEIIYYYAPISITLTSHGTDEASAWNETISLATTSYTLPNKEMNAYKVQSINIIWKDQNNNQVGSSTNNYYVSDALPYFSPIVEIQYNYIPKSNYTIAFDYINRNNNETLADRTNTSAFEGTYVIPQPAETEMTIDGKVYKLLNFLNVFISNSYYTVGDVINLNDTFVSDGVIIVKYLYVPKNAIKTGWLKTYDGTKFSPTVDIASMNGVLPIKKGGTGVTDLVALKKLLGDVSSDISNVVSWNNLTDKPFEDGEHIYIKTSDISADTIIDIGDGILVHVTDTTLSKSSLIGATAMAHFPDGSSQSAVATEANILAEYDGGIVLQIMNVVFVWVCYRSGIHTVTVNGDTVTAEVPKTGIYTFDFLLTELSAMEFLCPTKYLNNKYLSIFNYEAASQTDILPETNVTFVSGEGAPETAAILTNGVTYHVAWDEEVYVLTAKDVVFDGIAGIAIGNTSIIGAGDDTGEPFVLGYAPDYGVNVFITQAAEDATHKIRIYQSIDETYTIKEEHLPIDTIEKIVDAYIEEALGGDY